MQNHVDVGTVHATEHYKWQKCQGTRVVQELWMQTLNPYTFTFTLLLLDLHHERFISPGLRLLLYVEQEEYIPSLSPSAGIRLVIHRQDEVAFPQQDGTLISPGYKTQIKLNLVRIGLRGHPYVTFMRVRL